MERKALMIVDPQYDFITGSLPIPEAAESMDALAEYICTEGAGYSHIIITADKHPIRHCSFKENGGMWPRHCVAESCGAAIWQPIIDALASYEGKVTFLHKGQDTATEEYSIFKNGFAAEKIKGLVESGEIDRIDICGLAGDICVASTVRDGIRMLGKETFRILPQYSPSLDGGKTIGEIMASLNQERLNQKLRQ